MIENHLTKNFQSDFSTERRVTLLAILLEAITVGTSTVIVLYPNYEVLQWLVFVGLLLMLGGLIGVGSYLWLRYSAQPEVEEKEQVIRQLSEHSQKIEQAKAKLERMETERERVEVSEATQLATRNGQYHQQMNRIADQRSQAEIVYRQTIQTGLRQAQATHLRQRLETEILAEANIPGIDQTWLQTLAEKQIVTANDAIEEWLEHSGLARLQIEALLAWRKELEEKYQDSQPTELPPNEIELITQEYQAQIAELDQEEIIAKATLEKDLFEIREGSSQLRERKRDSLSAARSAMRGLEERKNNLENLVISYHSITFNRYFALVWGSAVGVRRAANWISAGMIHMFILGLILFQGTLSIWAVQNMLRESFPTTTPATVEAPIPEELTCLPSTALRQVGVVSRVVDGDTIDVLMDGVTVRVRYVGVDSPEPNQDFGGLSLNHNIQLVAGKQVTLVKDVSETDSFGRLLRYVLVEDLFVNYQMVLDGYAIASAFPPDTACRESFESAQNIARVNREGMWDSREIQDGSPGNEPAPCSCAANTLNCSDFSTHNEAQACYDTCIALGMGDIHRLDGNADGMACESLP